IRIREKNLPVLECSGLALVTIHDDEGSIIFLASAEAPDRIAYVFPFLSYRNASAAQPSQVRVVELVKEGVGPTADGWSFRPINLRLPGAHHFNHIGVGLRFRPQLT